MSSTLFKVIQMTLSQMDKLMNDSPIGDPTYTGDAYPEYERLLARAPYIRSYVIGGWCVLGFEEVKTLLTDRRLSSDLRNNLTIRRMYEFSARGNSTLLSGPLMLNTDAPEHTRLRKLARSGFTNTLVKSLEPRVRELIEESLSEVKGSTFDLIATLAIPVPSRLISELIGIETKDQGYFSNLADEFLKNAPIIEFGAMRKAEQAYREMNQFISGVVDKKRQYLGDDFLSLLLESEEDGDKLSTEELTRMCVLLVAAGYQTTTRLVGNAVYLLLKHPEQLDQLRSQPELLTNVVEESLRFEPPVQSVLRTVMEDMEIGDNTIRKGQTLVLIIAAANRDPAANANPNRFDITRSEINHVGFGYGIHLCLGAELARLETRLAIEMLIDQYSEISLMSEHANWESGYLMRGLTTLPLKVKR